MHVFETEDFSSKGDLTAHFTGKKNLEK